MVNNILEYFYGFCIKVNKLTEAIIIKTINILKSSKTQFNIKTIKSNPVKNNIETNKPLNKITVRKDRIGIGVLLEISGLFIGLLTFWTIIGLFLGIALFFCGYAIARQKCYLCVNCGNEISSETKICPICHIPYD